ncbi:MAG: flagellar basal body-associated FliL family protein [Polyangiaceae bacterium]|nr:flagellar basal body-associated FliL family protein [Polyangiaceae bacterium]
MSDPKAEVAPAAPKPSKSGLIGALIGGVLSAGISGGAAYGGARAASSHEAPVIEVVAAKPPGATIALEPFVAHVADADGKQRALKLTLAVELRHEASEDEFKPFIPRVRDATLSYVRGLSYEQLQGDEGMETIRKDLLEKFQALGVHGAERILVTDFITQ